VEKINGIFLLLKIYIVYADDVNAYFNSVGLCCKSIGLDYILRKKVEGKRIK